ncbi:MAG: AMP-binding protein [Gemmatimonadaceae bacterium]|nr:AMP-binding protein [Gemmatimonadaceae bacterium]
MTDTNISDDLRAWIGERFLPAHEAALLAPDTPLISGGILDSISTLGLVAFLEERYGIELEAHEVGRDRLDTLPRLNSSSARNSSVLPDRGTCSQTRSRFRHRPVAIASRFRDANAPPMSYGDLDARAQRVALFLHARGISTGDRVALYLPKSSNAIAFMLGVLRAGAAYVPIDPAAPPSRAAQILADCSARIAVVDTLYADALTGASPGSSGTEIFALTDSHARDAITRVPVTEQPMRPAHSRIEANAPAYIVHTSGSTGRPKGVEVSHEAAMTFVRWAVRAFELSTHDCLASHAPLHFDLSVFDIFAAQCA